jgi:succinate dehydrogenase (ubiquinone) cytochrome b560 subunit
MGIEFHSRQQERRVTSYSHTTSTTNSNVKTQLVKPSEAGEILVAQRLKRPLSPHLAIYKFQLTSVNSSLERITGLALAGGLYIFGIAYVASPYLGWDLSSGALAAAMAGLPWAGKVAVKFGMAWPFFFHGFNSLRHVAWDMAKGFKMATVYQTGYAAAGLSILAAAGFSIWF